MARSPGVVNIKRYQQRTNPSGPSPGFARAQELPDPFGGMLDGLAEGGAAFGDMIERGEQVDLAIERIEIARDEDDARAYSARAVADATRRHQESAAQIESEAEDGWRGITVNFEAAAAEINNAIIEAAPTAISRQFVEHHVGLLHAENVARMAARERDLRRGARSDEFDATLGIWESALLSDPAQWARAHATVSNTIGSQTDMTADWRRDTLAASQARLAFFAVSGMMQRDPAGTIAQLQAGGSAGGGRAEEVAAFLRENGIRVTSVTRGGNAMAGGHDVGNSIDVADEDQQRAIALVRQQFPDLASELVPVRAGQSFGTGADGQPVVATGNHGHIDLGSAAGGADGAAPTANSPFAFLSAEHRLALMRQQSTQIREQEIQARALWEAGEQAPEAPSVEAVRLARGDVAAADYAVALETFRARSEANTQTNAELSRRASAAPLQQGTERERLDSLARRNAATQILARRSLDPRAVDLQQGILPNAQAMSEAIGSGNLTQVGSLLRRRAAHAQEQAVRLGPSVGVGTGVNTQLNPLTRGEAAQLRGTLDRLTPDQRLATLSILRQSASMPRSGDGGSYAALVTQLYSDNPGALAGAGLIPRSRAAIETSNGRVTGEQAARRLMSGAALLNPPAVDANANGATERQRSTFNMADPAAMEGAFNDYVGDAYANDPDGYNNALQAFRAYYAGAANERGINAAGLRYSMDMGVNGDAAAVALAGEAANVAVGNLRTNEFGGRQGLPTQTYLPWGMDEGMFMRSLEGGWASIRSRYGAAELRDNPSDYDYAPDENGYYMVFYRGRAVPDGEGGLVLVRPRLNGQ